MDQELDPVVVKLLEYATDNFLGRNQRDSRSGLC